jgi:hypothetical protein
LFLARVFGQERGMEKQPDDKHGVFDDDDLDEAIANVDDTGMVKTQQQIVEGQELEELLPDETEKDSP